MIQIKKHKIQDKKEIITREKEESELKNTQNAIRTIPFLAWIRHHGSTTGTAASHIQPADHYVHPKCA